MSLRARLPLLLLAGLGCSNLTDAGNGVIAIEVQPPSPAVIETGETIQLSARALNADGDSVPAALTWVTPDTTITLDPATGQVTGRAPGAARVQAAVGSLVSSLISLTVVTRADTLIVASGPALATPPDQPASPPLAVRVESFTPAGPAAATPVIFTLVLPAFTDPSQRTVELPNGALADTVATAEDGTASVTLNRVAGVSSPDSAVVEVSAVRTRGDPVPGSGQRFTVTFPPAFQ